MNSSGIDRVRLVSGILTASALFVMQAAQAQTKPPQIISDYVETGGAFVCGGRDSDNVLIITNGGSVHCQTAYIGQKRGANNNSAIVTGKDAFWYDNTGFDIGDKSCGNTLRIANGGKVSCNAGYLGWDPGANGNGATVTGEGSIWNISETLTIGHGGSFNTLLISDGGTVYSSDGAGIGANGGSSNTAVVAGITSVWNVELGAVSVGAGGQTSGNMLTMKDGGSVAGGVVVNPGATLGGNGTIGSLTIAAGGILSPGDPVGKLTIKEKVTLNAGAKLAFDLGGPAKPGEDYDQVVVMGTLNLGGIDFSSLNITAKDGFGTGVYKLFEAAAIEGNLGATAAGKVNDFTATLGKGADGKSVVLTVTK